MSLLTEKETRFTFKITGSGAHLSVVDVTLEEELSRPFAAELVLASEDAIGLDEAVGKEALLTLVGASTDRLVHGIVSRFAQTGKRGRFLIYEARLVPQLWLLSQRRDSRIYQGDSSKDIIGKVFKDAQIPADRIEFRPKDGYKPKDYAVQYQETDLAFVSRLAEEEGVWFFFEQSKDKDVAIFSNSKSAYKPIAGDAALPYKLTDGKPPTEEAVYQWSAAQMIVPGKVSLNDFNYTKPSTALGAHEQGKNHTSLEVYEHPGRYEDEETGKRLTKIRLEEQSAKQKTAQGLSTCPRLTPGYTFTLKGHETKGFDGDYLVVSVTHHGKEPQALAETGAAEAQSYYNEFTAIPADLTVRPPRLTPRPVIMGPQTAIVSGAKDQEIYTDDLGRVKVKFHWDRGAEKHEKSSCWIRVSQLWAGEGWGAMFIPRAGQEVIVSFIDGDPDRPIITGRVYNGANPVPHALPGGKTKSTIMSNSSKGGGGKNELTFDDAKGSEQIALNGQKDLSIAVGNDKTESVKHDEKHSVGNDQTDDVKHDYKHSVGHDETRSVGNDQTVSVKNNRTKTVGVDEHCTVKGSQTIDVTVDRTVTVKGSESSTVTGGRTLMTKGIQTETVKLASTETIGLAKALSVGAAYQVSVGGLMNESVVLARTEQVGKAKVVIVGGTMTEKVTGSRSMSALKSHSIKANEIVIDAGSSITIKTGEASLTLSSNGNIDLAGKKINIKGSDVTVNGSGDLTLKGKKIAQN